mgnify:CR=1 FL=1
MEEYFITETQGVALAAVENWNRKRGTESYILEEVPQITPKRYIIRFNSYIDGIYECYHGHFLTDKGCLSTGGQEHKDMFGDILVFDDIGEAENRLLSIKSTYGSFSIQEYQEYKEECKD